MAIKNSDYYKEKLDNYNSQFTSALDDFKKYYVFFNLNPESDEYKNSYDNIIKQLKTIIKGVDTTTDEIQNDVEKVNNTIMGVLILVLKYTSELTQNRIPKLL